MSDDNDVTNVDMLSEEMKMLPSQQYDGQRTLHTYEND
ncbi:hypothetical protein T4A_11169 [Trichinella pseudospiralis]|uniref:Uncharacterized protein n=1 Tax=Trichinella pseudospiralis TaxID=6337 RepID=A0A0V1BC56_TRIPS|nr:hypothetical protein T4A_11169 [Trichinella pseudospiralis]